MKWHQMPRICFFNVIIFFYYFANLITACKSTEAHKVQYVFQFCWISVTQNQNEFFPIQFGLWLHDDLTKR